MKQNKQKILMSLFMIFLFLFTTYFFAKSINYNRILLWPDSIGYLQAASDALEKGVFTHIGYRSFVYPLVLYLILFVNESPLNIIYIQLIMAWMAILIIITVGRIAIGKINNPEKFLIFKLIGLAVFTLFLIAYRPIWNLAQAIMPETLASLMLAIWCLGVLILFYSESSFMRYFGMFVSMSIAGIIYLVKPHFILASVLTPLGIFLISQLQNDHKHRYKLYLSGFIYVMSISIFISMYKIETDLKEKFNLSYASQLFGARSLFCNNADIIIKNNNEDKLIPGLYSALELAVNKPSGFVVQGFDGDNCMYGPAGSIVQKYFEGRPNQEFEYYLKVYIQSILSNPYLLLSRLYRQGKYLIMHMWVDGNEVMGAGDAVLKGHVSYRQIYTKWYENNIRLFKGDVYAPFSFSFNIISIVTGILTVLATMTTLYSWWSKSKLSGSSRAFLVVMFFFLSTNVLISTVHTFDNKRYITVQWPIIATLTVLSSIIVLDLLYKVFRRVCKYK